VRTQPGDPRATYIETSFGLLVSHDDACSFRWICAPAIAEREDVAPVFRVARDGAMFAATPHGLRVSRDGGCSFTSATGQIAETWIAALDVGPTGEVWVATADGGKPNDVFRSTDGGATFASAGLWSSAIWWRSVAVAPSRAARVYATGYQVAAPTRTHVEITDDGGAHWTASALAGVELAATPLVMIQAIDRADPDHVFLSSVGAAPPSGDRLYRSRDGGATWREVLAAGAIHGVAISGATVVVATAPRAFVSHDGGETFTEAAGDDAALGCAAAREDGELVACGAAVRRSRDGAAWRPLLTLDSIAGPVACPAGTPGHDVCAAQWPALAAKLGAPGAPAPCPTAPPRARGGCCDAGGADANRAIGLALLAITAARRARRRARRASSETAG
jgi:hypothetical protein